MQINSPVKWPRLAGVAFALLFAVLLSLRLGLFREQAADRAGQEERAVPASAKPVRDIWLSISQEGRKIGYARRRFLSVNGGYQWREEVFLRINTLGVVQPLSFQTEGNLDPQMLMLSFKFNLSSSLFHFTARGTVKDNRLILWAGKPGEEKKTEMALRGPVRLPVELLEASQIAGLKVGEIRTINVFDPMTMGERPVRVSLVDSGETILHLGKRVRARKYALDFMGATQFAWLGEDGLVLREKGLLGITLESATKQDALAGIAQEGSFDLAELASVAANREIKEPGALAELSIRLGNLGATAFSLDGGRQVFRDGVLRIRKESLPPAQGRERIDQESPFLKPGPLIQSDHPLIVKKAREIVASAENKAEQAKKLLTWVHKHVKKQPLLSVPNALETLMNLKGDCNEHAMLLAALARAAGIPAEIEAGLVYMRGRFYYHAWNVLYLGDWVTADAVLGQMPADVTHLRFVRGSLERQADLLGLIGQVQLEIISETGKVR